MYFRLKICCFWLILITIVVVVFEMVSFAALALLARNNIVYAPQQPTLTEDQRTSIGWFLTLDAFDPILGWTNRLNAKKDNGVNKQRLRNSREFAVQAPEGVKRIAAFGDSFTYGFEVDAEDTWTAHLEGIMPSHEFLNFGVAAYGLDQSYLRYVHEGKQFRPDTVLYGYTLMQSRRLLKVFKPFAAARSFPHTKPRFVWKHDQLTLIENPFTKLSEYQELLDHPEKTLHVLGEHDGYYQSMYYAGPWDNFAAVRLTKLLWYTMRHSQNRVAVLLDTRGEQHLLTTKLLETFADAVHDDGSSFAVILFPTRPDLNRVLKGQSPYYVYIQAYLEEKGIAHIDLLPVFTQLIEDVGIDALFMPDDHYSPLAHEAVAKHIADWLQE